MVVMGRVLAPYGVKGWIKARSFAVSPTALLEHATWWLAPRERDGDGAWREFRVLSARCHSESLIAELEGLGDREAVLPWRGADVGVPRTSLPRAKDGEVYWADLVGMVVVNRSAQVLGQVLGLVDTGVHPVLRVGDATGEGPERLIPLVPIYLDAVDQTSRTILVDWQLDY
jgi:16S rRNA processing protein RimM